MQPLLDSLCGKHLRFRDFIECSDTWKLTHVDNIPKAPETFAAMAQLAQDVLDPVCDSFGPVKLTYGFSSATLIKEIQKNQYPNITPSSDQHMGCERNSNNKTYCDRLGLAVDFYVPGHSSLLVAQWIVKNTPFDRLYFYSPHRPIHVSIGPENNRKVVWMDGYRGGRHQPIRTSTERFLSFREPKPNE